MRFGIGRVHADLSEREIVQAALDVSEMSCIYFLIDGEQIVYVGQSRNGLARIAVHKKAYQFDKYSFFVCPVGSLDFWEAWYILKFDPQYNSTLPRGVGFVSMAHARRLVENEFGKNYGPMADAIVRRLHPIGIAQGVPYYWYSTIRKRVQEEGINDQLVLFDT